jgi:hypothetical protein
LRRKGYWLLLVIGVVALVLTLVYWGAQKRESIPGSGGKFVQGAVEPHV